VVIDLEHYFPVLVLRDHFKGVWKEIKIEEVVRVSGMLPRKYPSLLAINGVDRCVSERETKVKPTGTDATQH